LIPDSKTAKTVVPQNDAVDQAIGAEVEALVDEKINDEIAFQQAIST